MFKRLWHWLWGKRNELGDLSYKDAFMAQIVLEITAVGTPHEFRFIPLHQTKYIHPVDNREPTVQATKERAAVIAKRKDELLGIKQLSKELIAELMPSATYLRAIQDKDGQYVTFEGNGRVAALKQVFDPADNIEIEVDFYAPTKPKQILKNIHKLRRMHNLS